LIIFNTSSGCPNYFYDGTWHEWCGTGVVPLGVISALDCGSTNNNGAIREGQPASGVSSEIPYTGGNGGTHNGQTVNSTGVTGLTATLNAGTFANGSGSLTYTITGTSSVAGTASFALNIGYQSCTLTLSIAGDVTNPTTGKIWMDRNLGASQVATSSTDAASYGDLYQWGRAADGHQIRTSGTTATLSSADQPGHGDFITASGGERDWRSPRNDNLWQGVSGTNNPCPSGYRLPTEAEWAAEISNWIQPNGAGAFASPLKLPMAGYRRNDLNGVLIDDGNVGGYWSSSVGGAFVYYVYLHTSNAFLTPRFRAHGFSVRCLKD
jgi:uncharacterized protein (TIGR02145 family)